MTKHEPASQFMSPSTSLDVASHAPAPLRDMPYWCLWRYETHAGDAKPRKIPIYANGERRRGQQGSPQDLAKLTTFAVAREAAIRLGMNGVGFAHTREGGVVTLDFDNCVQDGAVDPAVLDLIGGTYCEFSPSGKGVHAIFIGNHDVLGNVKSHATDERFGAEVFSSTGFTTFSGWMLDHVEILGYEDRVVPIPERVIDFCQQRFGEAKLAHDSDDFMVGHEPKLGLTLDKSCELLQYLDPDCGRDEWIRVALALSHEYDNSEDAFQLWNDWSALGGKYPSEEALRQQWDSFGRHKRPGRRQVTMATVIKMAKDAGYKAAGHTVTSSLMSPGPEAISATPYAWRAPGLIPKRPWLFGRWLLKGTVACVVAPGGVGKSTFVTAIAISCATGRDLLNQQVWGGPKTVWLWNLEDDLDELSRTIQATCLHYKVAPENIAGRLFVDSAMDGHFLSTATEDQKGFSLHDTVFEAIATEIKRRGIEVLIVDPFVSSHAVEENSNSKIDKIVKAWGRVAKAAQCVIILVHHTSKAGAAEVNANSARGASALTSAARTVLTLNRMTGSEADKYGMSDEVRRRHIAVIDDKHNRAPAEGTAWYHLVSVEIGNGDSVAVCEPWLPPTMNTDPSSSELLILRGLLDGAEYRESKQANDWIGIAIAEALKADLGNTQDNARVKATQKEWIRHGYLRVERRSQKGRSVPFIVPGPNLPACK